MIAFISHVLHFLSAFLLALVSPQSPVMFWYPQHSPSSYSHFLLYWWWWWKLMHIKRVESSICSYNGFECFNCWCWWFFKSANYEWLEFLHKRRTWCRLIAWTRFWLTFFFRWVDDDDKSARMWNEMKLQSWGEKRRLQHIKDTSQRMKWN